MARTRLVSSTMPAVQLPEIEGNSSFVKEIKAALDYLDRESPRWYFYVVKPTRLIKARPSYEGRSLAYGGQDRMDIGLYNVESSLQLAAILVHEACHLHQWDAGLRTVNGDDEKRMKAELECYSLKLEMVRDISPGDPLIHKISAQLRSIRQGG